MDSAERQRPQSIRYSPNAIQRAARAVQCSPFRASLFATMQVKSVELSAIAGNSGVQNGYSVRPLTELAAESELLWLIQTGLLRREVDGQGITDSFRLTPLGRQLLNQWQRQGGHWTPPSWWDYWLNALNRWLRLPSWLQ